MTARAVVAVVVAAATVAGCTAASTSGHDTDSVTAPATSSNGPTASSGSTTSTGATMSRTSTPRPATANDARRGHIVQVRSAPSSASYPRGTSARRIVYISVDDRRRAERVSGLVLVPPGTPPAGGWPVVAWDHGTTGIGDACAPSTMSGAAYPDVLGALLRGGYAIAATDYPGLGTPGVHPYLDAPVAALATVDIVRAAHRLDRNVSTRWAAVGHSQGGQAAWATDELAPSDVAGTDYRGAVAFAPAPNFGPLLSGLRGSTDPLVQEFLLMLLTGLQTRTPFDYARVLGPRARAELGPTRTACFDELTKIIAAAKIPGSDILPRANELPWLARALRPFEIGHRHTLRPLLVLQGLADQVVPPSSTRAEVAQAKELGDDVTLKTFSGATHGTVLQQGAAAAGAWLEQHLRR